MRLEVKYGGLLVDGVIAQHPHDLSASLQAAEQLIDDTITKLKAKHPEGNPSVWVLYLGVRESVLSELGQTTPRQGVYAEIAMLQEPFHGLWQTVLAAGFEPEAREASSFLGAPAGVYLLVKRPA